VGVKPKQPLLWVLALVAVGHAFLAAQVALFTAWRPTGTVAIICVVSLLKSIGYGVYLRRMVVDVIVSAERFHSFLAKLVGLMFVAIASYGADFFTVYAYDPASLSALSPSAPVLETLFNCWYFSVLNFSFFGVADIIPSTIGSRFLLALEALASFLTLVFILSDFGALRESVRRANMKQYEKS